MIGDGLRCLFGEQADESHLNCDGVGQLIFVAIHKLKETTEGIRCDGDMSDEPSSLSRHRQRRYSREFLC